MIRSALFAATLMSVFAALPASAQNNGASDNDMVSCKSKYETQKVDVQGAKDMAKQAAAMKELDMAKDAIAKGNSAECLSHIEKSSTALR